MNKAMPKRKSLPIVILGAFLAAAILLPSSAIFAAADDYPKKPVRFVIPFAPGGSTDVVGRLIATKLSQRLGHQFIVENRSGAGSALGSEMVSKSAPDGYTLLFNTSAYATNPLITDVPYDPEKAFVPIAKVGGAAAVLSVHPSVPANSVKDLIALAKKQPGKLVSSGAGIGSFGHLASELFRYMAGIDYKIVQFKGGGPAMIDTVGGHSQINVGSLALTLPQIRTGKLKALGYGALTRSRLVPNMPTISDSGVPGYEAIIWWVLAAPAGTPKAIVERLYKELEVILQAEDMKKAFDIQGADIALIGPAETVKFIEAERVKWGKLIKEANIKVK
ncbi:MAG: tripartite tricarboxylate transporter substrate binding protein [Proteobacteria bacterium]|nr:tripartite tricarboxylate transporter substrate binding protein [Pseudomonadota bacterium]